MCVNTAKHGVACDQLEPCKKWHRHPQILFGVFKSVGGQFLESRTDTHSLSTPSIYIYPLTHRFSKIQRTHFWYITVILKNMKTSENQPEIYQFFLKTADSLKFFFGEEITATNQMVLWSEFSWKNRNRWLCDSEIFEEPIEACELLEMQRTH